MQECPRDILQHLVLFIKSPIVLTKLSLTCKRLYAIINKHPIIDKFKTLHVQDGLVMAVSYRELDDVVQYYVDNGAYITQNILLTAIRNGCIVIVSRCTERNIRAYSVCETAAQAAQIGVMEYIRKRYPNTYNYEIRGVKVMINAVKSGCTATIQYCIDAGNSYLNDGMFEAIRMGDMAIIHFFIERVSPDWVAWYRVAVSVGNVKLVTFFMGKIEQSKRQARVIMLDNVYELRERIENALK